MPGDIGGRSNRNFTGSTGGGGVSGSSSTPGPGSKLLQVDGARTDAYVADGSDEFPFKTIMAAVNKVIANGDNAGHPYVIRVAPGTYAENLVFENAALHTLALTADAWTPNQEKLVNIQPGAGASLKSTVNNGSLVLSITGFEFGATQTLVGGSTESFFFYGCVFEGGTFSMNNVFSVIMTLCNTFCDFTVQGSTALEIQAGCTLNSAGTSALTGTAFVELDQVSFFQTAWTVASGTELRVLTASRGAPASSITVASGGTLRVRQSLLQGTTTINAGGVTQFESAWIASLVGAASVDGLFTTGNVLLGSAAPTVGAGQVGLGSTTAATATAGGGALPATPTAFLVINVAGTLQKIPYYNT